MPWRARYIATRRHPLAIACYSMSAIIGLSFLLGLFHSTATANITSEAWETAWHWELCLGGFIGLAGALWPAGKHLDDALNSEALGAMLASVGFIIWTVTSGIESHWRSPAALLFAILGAGLGVRAGQAMHDRGRWLELTSKIRAEQRAELEQRAREP